MGDVKSRVRRALELGDCANEPQDRMLSEHWGGTDADQVAQAVAGHGITSLSIAVAMLLLRAADDERHEAQGLPPPPGEGGSCERCGEVCECGDPAPDADPWLEAIGDAIDNELGWDTEEDREGGDYPARIKQAARELRAAREQVTSLTAENERLKAESLSIGGGAEMHALREQVAALTAELAGRTEQWEYAREQFRQARHDAFLWLRDETRRRYTAPDSQHGDSGQVLESLLAEVLTQPTQLSDVYSEPKVYKRTCQDISGKCHRPTLPECDYCVGHVGNPGKDLDAEPTAEPCGKCGRTFGEHWGESCWCPEPSLENGRNE